MQPHLFFQKPNFFPLLNTHFQYDFLQPTYHIVNKLNACPTEGPVDYLVLYTPHLDITPFPKLLYSQGKAARNVANSSPGLDNTSTEMDLNYWSKQVFFGLSLFGILFLFSLVFLSVSLLSLPFVYVGAQLLVLIV
jgi:hypothetical protein